MVGKLKQLKTDLESKSFEFEKQRKSIQHSQTNPTFVHHCVKVKAPFERPHNAHNFPGMPEIYNRVQQDLRKVDEAYQALTTRIIVEGQKAILFQYRLDRIQTLLTTLVNQIACFHALYFRQKHKTKHTLQPDYRVRPPAHLASLALYRLLDLGYDPLLRYLDVNKPALLAVFGELYPDTKKEANLANLNSLDKLSVQFTQTMIASYLGLITWIPHNKKAEEEREQAAILAVQAGSHGATRSQPCHQSHQTSFRSTR